MPRLKGSKNKPKAAKLNSGADLISAIDAKTAEKAQLEENIAETQKEIDRLKVQLKANRTSLKSVEKALAKLQTQKAAEDAIAAQQAYQNELNAAVQRLLEQGMSMEDILGKLNG